METKENKYGTSCQSQETKVAAGKGSLRRTFVIITEDVVKKRGNSVSTLPDYLQHGCHAWLPLNEMAPEGQGIIILNIAQSDAKLLLNRKAFLPKHFIYGRAESRQDGTGKDGFLVEMYERRDDTDDYAVTQTGLGRSTVVFDCVRTRSEHLCTGITRRETDREILERQRNHR